MTDDLHLAETQLKRLEEAREHIRAEMNRALRDQTAEAAGLLRAMQILDRWRRKMI